MRRSSCSSPLNRKSQSFTRGGAVIKKKSCLPLIGDARQSSGVVSALDKSLRLRFSGRRFLLDGWTPLFFPGSSGAESWRLQAPPADVTFRSWRCRVEPHLLLPRFGSVLRPLVHFLFFFFETSSRVTKLQTESQLASTAGAVTKYKK